MKHKFIFTVQVFSILIVFITIFISSLLRANNNRDTRNSGGDDIMNSRTADRSNSFNVFLNPFSGMLEDASADF